MVYVSAMFNTRGWSIVWPYAQAAHLYADSDDELLAFARRIGLNPDWAQKEGTYKFHFDVTERKQVAALAAGAILQTAREEGLWLRERRRKQAPQGAEGMPDAPAHV